MIKQLLLNSAFVVYEEFCRSRTKHLCTVWGYPKFGNIFTRFRAIRYSETSFHCLGVSEIRKHLFTVCGVSEIRKHLCTVWGSPKFGNIFALFGGIRNSETTLHCLGVSEIRKHLFTVLGVSEIGKHLCTVWGYPKFGNIFSRFGGIRNSETSFHGLGVSEIRKHLCTLWGCTKFGNFSFHSWGVSKFRVKPLICPQQLFASEPREFLLRVFILNSRFREKKENSILCKGGVLEIRAKFTFNFLPKFNLFWKKNMILPCLNQLVGQRLPISSQKYTIFLAFLSVCSEFSKNVMPQISLERVKYSHHLSPSNIFQIV